MAKMTLQKANAKSKALKKKIDNWYDNNNPMIAYYTTANPYIGTIPIDQYEEDIKSQWQSINDLLDQYAKYNYTVMNTLGTVKVKVPKMITITNIDKPTEYEETNIAEAIRRKNLYRELSIVFVGTLINFIKNTNGKIERQKETLNKQLLAQVNSQFGPQSTATAKARNEYTNSIKDQYELKLINPLDLERLVPKLKEKLDSYVVEIDSTLSHIFETTEVEVED